MNTWQKLRMILTTKCEHASQLTSKSLDGPLAWYERAALRTHKYVCRSCHRFDAQLVFLRAALRESGRRELQSLDEGPTLDNDAKAKIKSLLK